MGIEESRPVHLMGFRRDVDGDYHYEPNGVASDWVLMQPAEDAPERPNFGRLQGKWEARHILNDPEPKAFDTLDAAALWVVLEVNND